MIVEMVTMPKAEHDESDSNRAYCSISFDQTVEKDKVLNRQIAGQQDVLVSHNKHSGVRIEVFTGEHTVTKDNHLLCKLHIDGIPPAHRDKLHIEVKNGLKNCCVSVLNTFTEEKHKDKSEAGDKEK